MKTDIAEWLRHEAAGWPFLGPKLEEAAAEIEQLRTQCGQHRNPLIDAVAKRLRQECLDVFGSTWSNDVARRFAEVAIAEIEAQGATAAPKEKYADDQKTL